MANTKKTTKSTPKVESEAKVEVAPKEETVVKVEAPAPTPKKEVKKFGPSDLIECRSVTAGELILVGPKTKLQYTWSDYGDTAYVEFQDLQSLQSLKSKFIVKPRFIIQDDDLVELWGNMLKPIYDKINNQSIEDLFELPVERFKITLSNFPDGMKETVKSLAVKMIQTEELYDIRKVRAIDEVLGTDFVEMYLK